MTLEEFKSAVEKLTSEAGGTIDDKARTLRDSKSFRRHWDWPAAQVPAARPVPAFWRLGLRELV